MTCASEEVDLRPVCPLQVAVLLFNPVGCEAVKTPQSETRRLNVRQGQTRPMQLDHFPNFSRQNSSSRLRSSVGHSRFLITVCKSWRTNCCCTAFSHLVKMCFNRARTSVLTVSCSRAGVWVSTSV